MMEANNLIEVSTEEKQLVMGAAVGYGVDEVFTFLSSLKRTGYSGDIALLVDKRLLNAEHPILENVILLPCPRWALGMGVKLRRSLLGRWLVLAPWQLPCWLVLQLLRSVQHTIGIKTRTIEKFARWFYHPQLSRYIYYREFLRTHEYEQIMLTDVRDVLFQSDPFQQVSKRGLSVSIESRRYTIANQFWNALWISTTYGPEMLERIGGNPVSCSGVTFGDYTSVTNYLDSMIGELLNLKFRSVMRFGGDQGLHNKLLWAGELGGEVYFMDTFESPVATISDLDSKDFTFSSDDRLLNKDGTVAAVVHQYDRCPSLNVRLRKHPC